MIHEDKSLGSRFRLLAGDCLHEMRSLADNSIDSVVTDPPYGLSFMGKKWDYDVPSVDIWREVFRVMKPGAHLLAFAGSRTYHRMAVNIEDAGFDIRDQLMWVYGSGFPKSHNISKAIDKAAGAKRQDIGPSQFSNKGRSETHNSMSGEMTPSSAERITASATDAAKQWDGWGTALKPAFEPLCLAQKPISEKTIAANVLKWGTGAINVNGCRITLASGETTHGSGAVQGNKVYGNYSKKRVGVPHIQSTQGRFPANLLLGHAPTCTEEVCDMFDCPIALLDGQSGTLKSGAMNGFYSSMGFQGSKSGHIAEVALEAIGDGT